VLAVSVDPTGDTPTAGYRLVVDHTVIKLLLDRHGKARVRHDSYITAQNLLDGLRALGLART
jgi:hypothetical protein